MMFADLHLHSPYSRAVSKDMTLEVLSRKAKEKGLHMLGTGDFSHPAWFANLKSKLRGDDGVYEYNGTKFVLSNEIALIYTQDGKGRRIHYILLAPDFGAAEQINEFLRSRGRLDYDGRPMFGFTSVELVERLMSISKDIEIIPAHAWTPWFSVFGSMSGFDSLKECFQEKVKYIHAIETGLSSSPAMNWRCSFLDNVTLLSNSDAHSPHPHRLGREANALDIKGESYRELINAIRTRKVEYTLEVSPDYGKYHYDGHRDCNISMAPDETKKHNGICPKCKKPLTIGVLNRVEQLADREEFTLKGAPPFKGIIPLTEIIALSVGQEVFTKKVFEQYHRLLGAFGNELTILLETPEEELRKAVGERLAALIIKNREGNIKIIPGYDGVYGKPVIDDSGMNTMEKGTLKKFF
ncbi:MAG: DNA helicase UvrD [Candidatus Aenigmarchaeota archaeon]|nr:DNA helicase UvrD [Candidatus Aenigmarchaeota archaeon]